MIEKKARLIAFYLPQYHPIPENDAFWGKGFTEWTNVTKAKPLYKGHKQPKLPADLGYYDLRVPKVRIQQAKLATEYGIEGFCYWHYWFGNGKRTLERIFKEVLASGEPNFPFCLGWANESWTGKWHGLDNEIIFEQTYPGKADFEAHFYEALPALKDKRNIRVNDKPLFLIYRPENIPQGMTHFSEIWQQLAIKEGLEGVYLVGVSNQVTLMDGLDGMISNSPQVGEFCRKTSWLDNLPLIKTPKPELYSYPKFVDKRMSDNIQENEFPVVVPNWDNTPRSGLKGRVLENSTPEYYGKWLASAIEKISTRPLDERIVFIKSWNEWAEGNYLEPDQQFGHQYLETTREIILGK